ncbi:cell division protein ZapA [Paenibacillus thermotolerans]|uniref:cell division protein ZapA n=1 Tax=Paenibacillus thermotolerans TaxID=3027807 RepID=UPI00236842DA|nr:MULTISPECIES: cell division protein ZapA [unclassified Paenibacillus]
MNGEDKVRLTIDIFGNSYKMVGTYSPKYVKQLSAYVNEHMNAVSKGNPRLDTQKVAILALVRMADEFFQLHQHLEKVENERAQSQQHMEQLRKAFELSEEKEQTKSGECRRLEEQLQALEAERERLAMEMEMASAAWAERVAEWERKYEELFREHGELAKAVETARQEAAAAIAAAESQAAAAAAAEAEAKQAVQQTAGSDLLDAAPDSLEEETLEAKYKRLQEEYVKLQNEFNEWIELTMSEPQ